MSVDNMQVVVLAGGIGTHLRPITYKVPKPMVEICGKPFLEYQLELIKKYGLTKVLLLVSYLGEQIEDYFGNGSSFGLDIEYSYESTPMGTGGALKIAEQKLENEFLLLNGDTLLPLDYGDLIHRFNEANKQGLVVACSNIENIVPNNLLVSESDVVVLDYNKHDDNEMTYIDAGAVVFKKEILEFIPGGCVCSLEKEVFSQLIEKQQLIAYKTDNRFYDMGTLKGLKSIEKVLS